MAQDYYTLEEAAQIVHISPDELKQLARKGELRSFQDRGTWRFRVQDIQELARRRGVGSDPELVLGEAAAPRPTDSPAPRSPASPKTREAEVFDLGGDDETVGLGKELQPDAPGSSRKLAGGSSKKNLKEGPKSGPKSPGPQQPPPGSDSDVRLVADGSDLDFQINLDSDVKMVDDRPPLQVKQRPKGRTGMTGPASPPPRGASGPASPRPKSGRSGTTPGTPAPVDSGVRLVPMDSDSDVRIVGASSDEGELPLGQQPPRSSADSDIRLEKHQQPPPGSDAGMLTEEINLDEELRKQEAQRKAQPQSKVRKQPRLAPQLPTTSPFELSEADLNLPEESQAKQVKKKDDSSSDFELTPAGDSSSPLELGSSEFELTLQGTSSSPLEPASSEEFRLELPDDEVGLGEPAPPGQLKGPTSGISLDNPVDSGISLEQGGEGSDEIEFELSLDAGNTPKPKSAAADSDSEFELTLDSEEPKVPGAAAASDSEFELTLDGDAPKPAADSSSEFELTLDDSGGLSPLDVDGSPQVKADDDKDIFETDFEVPALEEESGSQAVALDDADTGLDSSDFDISLSGDEIAVEDESGSEVVPLDEEDADPAAATQAARARKKGSAAVADLDEEADPGFGEIEEEGAVEEDAIPGRTVVKEKLIPAAPWGAMPVVFMLPCVFVMFVLAILGFELVQSMSGYKSPGLLTKAIGDLLGQKLK